MLRIEEELNNFLCVTNHAQRLEIGRFSKPVDVFDQILGPLPSIGVRSLSLWPCVVLSEPKL